MSEREALLIGVPKYPGRPDLDLEVVCRDVADLQSALEDCGYKVQVRGTADPAEVTRNSIRRFIRESCTHASAGSTLLIRFSGHGINYQGKDLLLPCDADLAADDLANALVPADISEMVAQSKAATVVFFVDACREGVEWGTKALTLTRLNGQQYATLREKCFVTVFACSEGQESQYVPGDEGFSLFTHALSKALSPQNAARTLHELLIETQKELDHLVKQFGKRAQVVSWKGEESAEKEWRRRIVSDFRPRLDATAGPRDWSQVVRETSLWLTALDNKADSMLDLFRHRTCEIAAQSQTVYRLAAESIPDDPWRDDTYALRVVKQLELLVLQMEKPELNAAEVSLLLLAPFVREAVFASAIEQLAASAPIVLDEEAVGMAKTNGSESDNDTMRRKLRLAQRMRPRLVRAAARLRNGKPSQPQRADAIALWIMHEFILRDPAFWQFLPTKLRHTLDSPAPKDHPHVHLMNGLLVPPRLLALCKCVGCEPTRIEAVDTTFPLQAVAVVVANGRRIEVREQLIGFLLGVAGWMALDVRQMPELVADHVAADAYLLPGDLVNTLQSARWRPMGTTRQLEATCGHQAIDYALRDYIRRSTEALQFVRERTLSVGHLQPLADLPTRLGDGEVRPLLMEGGVYAYELPHISFTLDPDEIREMLMGQQLYSEPELAIRELYQNALDACRYCRARLDYLRRRNECPHEHLRWEGLIQFVHARTEARRPYVECSDTGVGMGKLELGDCFAKAGRRFRDMPEFLEEQELWFGCDPPIRMYPNSQFGIGVFSYFMLADELEVETCRLDRLGRLGRRYLAHISAGGKLFRVQDLGPGTRPGTRVRLYLKDEHMKGFLAATLSAHLRIAEFATEVSDGRERRTWMAATPDAASPAGHPDVWWVNCGDGEVLSDGLRVMEIDNAKWVKRIGAIVNLTGERLPRLTVDRKKMLDWDQSWGRKTVEDCLLSLATSKSLSMSQLWVVQKEFPSAVHFILMRLKEVAVRVPIGIVDTDNLFTGSSYDVSSGLREAQLTNTVIRADRVGIDKRDIGILALRGRSTRNAAGILATTGWIANSAEARYALIGGFAPLDSALGIHHALREHGTDLLFRDRLSAWTAEGLAVHPYTQAIADSPAPADYRAYRRNLRRYRLQRLKERLQAFPSVLREHWIGTLAGLLVVLALVGGVSLYPKVAIFAIVTAAALVAVVTLIIAVFHFAGKLK